MLPPHTTVVFSGGGTRGLAFAGALESLRKRGIDWGLRCPRLETVAGCSIGAMTALLICLGFSAHEIAHLVTNMSFNDLVSLEPMQVLQVVTAGSLGLDPGQILRNWLSTQIALKTGLDVAASQRMTMAQLQEKTGMNFVCVATNVETRKMIEFSAARTPGVAVVDAVRASMALPPLFQPVDIAGTLYSDGGLVNNFPMDLFPQDSVLGLRLCSTPQSLKDIRSMRLPLLGFVSYVLRVTAMHADAAAWEALDENMRNTRVILLPCGKVSTFESDVASVRDQLFRSGEKGVDDFWDGKVDYQDEWIS